MKELVEFTAIMNRLAAVWPSLPNKAASVAVNFSKDRFRQANWVGDTTKPWKRRKAKGTKDDSRAILVKTGNLKRDVQKIRVTAESALVGTSNLTGDYAKLHNEGFRGSMTIKEHKRKHYLHVKEKYKTRTGKDRSRTRKTVNENKVTTVKTHIRKVNIPSRRFLGASPVLDKQIERMMTAEILRAIRGS
jgi:phage gpG-like protein